jgi:hypothetical protein
MYDPLSRLCAMNPRMAMDCIAWARMPTAAWSHEHMVRAVIWESPGVRCDLVLVIPGANGQRIRTDEVFGTHRSYLTFRFIADSFPRLLSISY